MTNGSLRKVESIAECSPRSILQYFWPALSDKRSWKPRTYDGGNGNHNASLPLILLKIKVDQMLPYISSLLVTIL